MYVIEIRNVEMIKILIAIAMILTCLLIADHKPYDGPDFDMISHRIKPDKSKLSGSGYVQNKPDPLNKVIINLVNKGKKYISDIGLQNTINLINEKPKKFRDFKTTLFIIDLNGNVLAHSGNPLFAGNNMLETKDSSGRYFIKGYINNISLNDTKNYINILTLEDDTQYIYNFVYLEKLNENMFIGAVAIP